MQVIILAGGYGTRLSEETAEIPKPLVRIGTLPIIMHIVALYSFYGHREIIVAGGYKVEKLEAFFYQELDSIFIENKKEKLIRDLVSLCSVRVVNTGLSTSTGGRLKILQEDLDEEFMFTYGDGVGNIHIAELLRTFKNRNTVATVTAVRPPARFGSLVISDGIVKEFREKDSSLEGWINGGFFVAKKEILNYLVDVTTPLEDKPLAELAASNQLSTFLHSGFWKPMDTLRDKKELEALLLENKTPWLESLK
jgi:glucose-1-phosphate cytidylyltransferase